MDEKPIQKRGLAKEDGRMIPGRAAVDKLE